MAGCGCIAILIICHQGQVYGGRRRHKCWGIAKYMEDILQFYKLQSQLQSLPVIVSGNYDFFMLEIMATP